MRAYNKKSSPIAANLDFWTRDIIERTHFFDDVENIEDMQAEGREHEPVTANGIRFRYIERGKGPLVLCMHGFADTAHTFDHLLSALANAGFRAIAPFTRGYAPTGFPSDENYQIGVQSQDVIALINALGDDSAFVVDHDWGGLAVMGAAYPLTAQPDAPVDANKQLD